MTTMDTMAHCEFCLLFDNIFKAMGTLPEELLYHISTFADPLTLANLSLASKDLNRISKDQKVWKYSAAAHVAHSKSDFEDLFADSNWKSNIISRYVARSLCFNDKSTLIRNKRFCPCSLNKDKNAVASKNFSTLSAVRLDDLSMDKIVSITSLIDNNHHRCADGSLVSDIITITDPSTGQEIGSFKERCHEDVGSYLLAIDQLRMMRIYDISNQTCARIHQVQLNSTHQIKFGSIFANQENKAQISGGSDVRRREGVYPNDQSALRLFQESQNVLILLDNNKDLKFYPIWFDSFDRGGNTAPTYPWIEQSPYYSLRIPQHSEMPDKAFCVRYNDQWLIFVICKSPLIMIASVKLRDGKLLSNWFQVQLRADRQHKSIIAIKDANICLKPDSKFFLNLYAIDNSGSLLGWSLLDVVSEKKRKYLCPIWTFSSKFTSEYSISWKEGMIMAMVYGDEQNKTEILCFDLLVQNSHCLTASIPRAKNVLFYMQKQKPMFIMTDSTGHMDLYSIGINRDFHCPSIAHPHVRRNMIAEWISSEKF